MTAVFPSQDLIDLGLRLVDASGAVLRRHFRAGLTGEELISRADRALYSSKTYGRNRVTRWSRDLPDPLAKKQEAAVSK